jgi:hypothetical protein
VPGWDEDSPQLRANLNAALSLVEDSALQRRAPSLVEVKDWHRKSMEGLTVPDPSVAGNFRGAGGQPYLQNYNVTVGGQNGADARQVDSETARFQSELERRLDRLDLVVPPGSHPLTDRDLDDVIELAAWAHAEWIRIHPFANGNGRTARMWANWILIRYEMPPFVVLRPRPGGGYGAAATAAMRGSIVPTVQVFQELYSAWSP